MKKNRAQGKSASSGGTSIGIGSLKAIIEAPWKPPEAKDASESR